LLHNDCIGAARLLLLAGGDKNDRESDVSLDRAECNTAESTVVMNIFCVWVIHLWRLGFPSHHSQEEQHQHAAVVAATARGPLLGVECRLECGRFSESYSRTTIVLEEQSVGTPGIENQHCRG
jgi:hypothetical protein